MPRRLSGLFQDLLGIVHAVLPFLEGVTSENSRPAQHMDEDVMNNGCPNAAKGQSVVVVRELAQTSQKVYRVVQDKYVRAAGLFAMTTVMSVLTWLKGAALMGCNMCIGALCCLALLFWYIMAYACSSPIGNLCINHVRVHRRHMISTAAVLGAVVVSASVLKPYPGSLVDFAPSFLRVVSWGRQPSKPGGPPLAVLGVVHDAGSKALANTADGIFSMAVVSKESEAVMLGNSMALSIAADIAVYLGTRFTMAESVVDQIRKDQTMKVGKLLHNAACQSRLLANAERIQCTDSAFEYRNISVNLDASRFDLQVGIALANDTILEQKVNSTYDALHGILDWVVRGDGAYSRAKHLGQQRLQLAKELQSISLEVGLLAPTLPSLANLHANRASVKYRDAKQLMLESSDAWWRSTQLRLQNESSAAEDQAVAHAEASKGLGIVQEALQHMYSELTSGKVNAHLQMLNAKHAESVLSREHLLSVLGMAKSVAVDPALATYLVDFLGDSWKVINKAAIRAAGICNGPGVAVNAIAAA